MSMTDPIADMIIRIKNGQAANKNVVTVPASKVKVAICNVLKEEGYIDNFSIVSMDSTRELSINLKYYKGRPVIDQLLRISKPGRRVYRSKGELPRVIQGHGIAVISTSSGMMSESKARSLGLGGEVLCIVS